MTTIRIICDFIIVSTIALIATTVTLELELKTYNITEKTPVNTTINVLMPGVSSKYSRIKVIGDGFDRYFHLNKVNGKIYLIKEIDLEDSALCNSNQNCCDQTADCKFVLLLRFFEHSTFSSITFTMHIFVNDVNDWSPKFKQDQYIVEFREGVKVVGEKQLLPTAIDKDFSAKNRQIKYRMQIAEEYKTYFQLLTNEEHQAPALLLLNALDCEKKNHYLIDLIASDGNSEGRLLLYVKVLDVNEYSPEFSRDLQTLISLSESTSINTIILKVNATDNDSYPNNKINYYLDNMNDVAVSRIFSIDFNNGDLFLKNPLDYEKERIYSVIIVASDSAPKSERRSSSISINISIQDVNDNNPEMKFETENKKNSIRENQPIGTPITIVKINDRDSNQNGDVTCKLPKSEDNFFLHKIVEKFYQIESNKIFDREEVDRYFVIITCSDHGSPSLTTTSTLTVIIEDENDQSPQFVKGNFHFKVPENAAPQSFLKNSKNQVARMDVSDPDLVGNISYYINRMESFTNVTSAIEIEPQSGILYSVHAVDREVVSEIRIKICCNDTVHATCIDIYIIVEDENDNAPYLISDIYRLNIEENVIFFDRPLLVFQPRDKDPTNMGFKYQFDTATIGDVYKYLQMDNDRLLLKKPLDREEISSLHFLVQIRDNHPYTDRSLHTSAKVFITVIDQNDNIPHFLFPNITHYAINLSCHEPIGHMVTKVIAVDPDLSENGTVTYELVNILPKNEVNLFHVDKHSGEIFINSPSLSEQFCRFNFILMISAKDLGDPNLRHDNARKFLSRSFSKLQITLLDIPRTYSARITHITPRLILTVILSCSTLFLISLLIAWAFIIFCQKNRYLSSKEDEKNSYYSMNMLNNNITNDNKIDRDDDCRSESITYIHRDDIGRFDSFSEPSASFRPITYCPVTPTILINPVASSSGHLCPDNPLHNYVKGAPTPTKCFTPPLHQLISSSDAYTHPTSIIQRAGTATIDYEPLYIIRGQTLSTPRQQARGSQSIFTTLMPHSSVVKFTPAFSNKKDTDSYSDTYV